MVKAVGEVGVDMITNLVNQIIAEWVIPVEWENGIFRNFYKGKGDALDRGNYRELKLTNQILKRVKRVFQKLIRQQMDAVRVYARTCSCKHHFYFETL